jgi:hypothetical protein
MTRVRISPLVVIGLAAAALTIYPTLVRGLASTATVSIKSLSPAAGTRVNATTILHAEIQYQISDFDPSHAKYVIAPFFDQKDGRGSFNALPHALDAKPLKKPSGLVELNYPIAREWASGDLEWPVRVVFRILEVTNGKTLYPLADSEPVSYNVE